MNPGWNFPLGPWPGSETMLKAGSFAGRDRSTSSSMEMNDRDLVGALRPGGHRARSARPRRLARGLAGFLALVVSFVVLAGVGRPNGYRDRIGSMQVFEGSDGIIAFVETDLVTYRPGLIRSPAVVWEPIHLDRIDVGRDGVSAGSRQAPGRKVLPALHRSGCQVPRGSLPAGTAAPRASLTAVAPHSGGSNRARPGSGVWSHPPLDGLHGRGRPGNGPDHGTLGLAAPRPVETFSPTPSGTGSIAPSSHTAEVHRGRHGGIVDCRVIRPGDRLVPAPSDREDAIPAVVRKSTPPRVRRNGWSSAAPRTSFCGA